MLKILLKLLFLELELFYLIWKLRIGRFLKYVGIREKSLSQKMTESGYNRRKSNKNVSNDE
jgi:hypothetical protein